jgi:hypothetical protein
MRPQPLFLTFLALALGIKLFLFVFAAVHVPQMKIEADSPDYLNTASTLMARGAFATVDEGGELKPHIFRTPGYPLFVGILHDAAGIPLEGVVFIQILLTLVVAWLVYLIALELAPAGAPLAALICLWDVPSTIWAQRIMAEALFTLLLVLSIRSLLSYFKSAGLMVLIGSALFLAAATYVRPISYFLAVPLAGFMVYVNAPCDRRRAFFHAVVYLAIVFALLGLWSLRNHHAAGTTAFSSVSAQNDGVYSVNGNYAQERYPQRPGMPDILYAGEIAVRSFATMMFNPGSWKYFDSRPLAGMGKVLAYLFMVFWLIGFGRGLVKVWRDVRFQCLFLVMAYFILVTVVNVGLCGNERFRVVIMPFIAIVAACGWQEIVHQFRPRRSSGRS